MATSIKNLQYTFPPTLLVAMQQKTRAAGKAMTGSASLLLQAHPQDPRPVSGRTPLPEGTR